MEKVRVKVTEAATILECSPQFVRVAMQEGILPIGVAVQMSSIWTYHISKSKLEEYCGRTLDRDLEEIRSGRQGSLKPLI